MVDDITVQVSEAKGTNPTHTLTPLVLSFATSDRLAVCLSVCLSAVWLPAYRLFI